MTTKTRGFTLIEILLVLTIISAFIYASVGYIQQRTLNLSIDRSAAQMQQVLNAGLSYYVNNGSWPNTITTDLQTGGYLPAASFVSPWGTNYTISNNNALLTVSLPLPAALVNAVAIGAVLAGKLPLASSGLVGGVTTITASVNVPGQDLNNATAVNFSGIYHNGACVPVPNCPKGPNGVALTPTIMVSPVSVSGMNNGSTDVYPISSFTAYATAPTLWVAGVSGPPACSSDGSGSLSCDSASAQPDDQGLPNGTYWRVCLQVMTEKGPVTWTNGTGQYATVMAITRCAISNENSGSKMTVYEQ